jgi:hypothetical protein
MKTLTKTAIIKFYNGEIDMLQYDLSNIPLKLKGYTDIIKSIKQEMRDRKLKELGI